MSPKANKSGEKKSAKKMTAKDLKKLKGGGPGAVKEKVLTQEMLHKAFDKPAER